MTNGNRREILMSGLERIFAQRFAGRVLPYDEPAVDAYAEILAHRRRIGRPTSAADTMIAGIAQSRGAALATRNVRDFEGCGIALVDPWH
jgi:predicted nucleic acid-binding protein